MGVRAMKALITGITGFVGPFLARCLTDAGHAIVGTSLSAEMRAGRPGEPFDLNSVPVLAWDVSLPPSTEVESRMAAFAPEVIVHLAAMSIPADCGDSEPTEQAWRANVIGTQRVLELIERLPQRPRLLFVSTSQVYAAVTREHAIVNESAPLGPTSGYAKTKLAAEQLIGEAVKSRQIDAVIVRPFKHTGSGQSSRMMVPEWASQFARGADPVLIRCRDSYVDLCDVRDVVRAYCLLAESRQCGAIYNVGSGVARRAGDIFDELHAMADPKRAVRETSPQVRFEPIADYSRIRHDVGWTPRVPLRQTLLDTLNYWRDSAK